MDSFDEKLKNIKAFVFDVDGVLSLDTTPLNPEGDPMRTANVKDGFAIRNALYEGFQVAIITGGKVESVRLRHEKIGVKHYYEGTFDKISCLEDFLKKTGISKKEVLYMGDDLVDFHVMREVGLPVCPADAGDEIKSISKYISPQNGGEGCVRDVIEKTMLAQNKWFNGEIKVTAW